MPPTGCGWRSIVSRFGRHSRSTSASVPLLAVLLTLASASPLEAQTAYRMVVNFAAGWKESGGFNTLEECKREAATFAAKYTAQAGCATVSALEKWRADEKVQQAAAKCAAESQVELVRKQGTYFTIFGAEPGRSAFDTCMAENRQPAR